MKFDIAGLKVDSVTKQELLAVLLSRITANQKTWITTVYSEFLHSALREPKVMKMLNQADIAVADGIGILWAQKFLSQAYISKNFWLKIIESYFQAAHTLLSIPFRRRWGGGELFKETIPGSELIWDIAKLAAENNLSLYLLGGFGDTAKLVSEKLKVKSENLKIAGWSSKNPNNESAIDDINKTQPDILLVAYGPIKQEQWILENRNKLPSVKLFMGVGGTFDYIAGKRLSPPRWIRKGGLEWLWRLFTQPHRLRRIWNATLGLINLAILFKIYAQMPLRRNAVSVILNSKNEVLICRRNPKPQPYDAIGENKNKFANYWQLPQGGLHRQESPVEGAKREAEEETGLNNLKLLRVSQATHSYTFPLTWIRVFNKNFRTRGQIQNIVFFKYSGEPDKVKVDNHEFIDFKWELRENLTRAIHSERNNLTEIVLEDLKEIQQKGIIDIDKTEQN